MTVRLSALLCALLVGAVTVASQAQKPMRVMIIDGESAGPYHDWQRTTPALRRMLDDTGLFQTTVVTLRAPAAPGRAGSPAAPGDGAAPAAVDPATLAFDGYTSVIFNYDAPDERWPEAVRGRFETYVRNGGGVVIVHGADNAFPGWAAFNEMAGIGGWRGRTEAAGPYWFFRDGQLASDAAPGRAGSHGKRVPFQVTTRDRNHPITRGLPEKWMHQGDELYARMRGPGKNMTVLATAWADPANSGTGRDEPMLMALSYGKGRVFHTTLGHDLNAMSSVGFVVTFQRGTEWTAAGRVTQKVPANFPTADVVSYRADIAAMDPRYANGLDPLTR